MADCFRSRSKIGMDMALETLKDAQSQSRVSFDDLWRCAQVGRVANGMRPYTKAMA